MTINAPSGAGEVGTEGDRGRPLAHGFSTGPVDLPRARRESRVYLGAVFVFAISAIATVWFCRSMPGGMEMPGGWTMSMMWMRMPGQSRLGAAGMFLVMWLAMMAAKMLPSALPTVLIYRRLLHFRRERHPALATGAMACAYLLVWLGFGLAAYVTGVPASLGAMRWAAVSRAVPAVSGALLIVGGSFQFTRWKLACLAHCREPLAFVAAHSRAGIAGGWNLGLHHGLFCAACCWGLMVIQLSLGVMSLAVMAVIAVVIALERLVPRADLVVRATGIAAVAVGLGLIGRALLR